MTEKVRLAAGLVGAALTALSLGRCTLLIGELPQPIDEAGNDGGHGGAEDGVIASGGSDGKSTGASGGSETGGEDGAGGDGARGGRPGGGTSSGGAVTGGAASGGTSSGGAAMGGNATSGTSSGGVMTGGVMTGGSMTGGSMTGGSTTGGSTTGGSMTGGSMTGGSMTGGRATGGAMTAGTAPGGRSSGGTSGTASGGTSGSAGGMGATSGGGRGGAPIDCDRDDDTYEGTGATCSATDCDDADFDAHPGQQGFFADARASGGYDYDCNGRTERQFETGLDCGLLAVASCSGEGFAGSPPACGAMGPWIRCAATLPPLPVCTSENQGMRRMACR